MSTLISAMGGFAGKVGSGVSAFAESGKLTSVMDLVGTGLEVYGTISSTVAQSKAAREEGRAERKEAEFEAEQLRRKRRKMTARQKVLYAKAGVDLEGSPLEVLEETRKEFEQDIGFTLEGGYARARAKKREASRISTAGYVSAGRSVLSGVGSFLTDSPLMKKKR